MADGITAPYGARISAAADQRGQDTRPAAVAWDAG